MEKVMGKEKKIETTTKKYSLSQIRTIFNIIINGCAENYPLDFTQQGIFSPSPNENSIMALYAILDRVNWLEMKIEENPEHTLEKLHSCSQESETEPKDEAVIHDFILRHVEYHNSNVKSSKKGKKKEHETKHKGKRKISSSGSFITSTTWASVCKQLFQHGQIFSKHPDKHAIVIFQTFCEDLSKAYRWLDIKRLFANEHFVELMQGENPWVRLKLEISDENRACEMLLSFLGELNQHDHLQPIAEVIHNFLHIGHLVTINTETNEVKLESLAMLFSQCLIDGLKMMDHGIPSFNSQELEATPLLNKLAKVANAPFQQLMSLFLIHSIFALPFHHNETQTAYQQHRQNEIIYHQKLTAYKAQKEECSQHLWFAVSGLTIADSEIDETAPALEPERVRKGFFKLDFSSIFQSRSPQTSPKSPREKHSPKSEDSSPKRSPKKESGRSKKGSRIRHLLGTDPSISPKSETMPIEPSLCSKKDPSKDKARKSKRRLSGHLNITKKGQEVWRSLQELTIEAGMDKETEEIGKLLLFSQKFQSGKEDIPVLSEVMSEEQDEALDDGHVSELKEPEQLFHCDFKKQGK